MKFSDVYALPDDATVDPTTAAELLGVKPSTLAVWRCTGRRTLPFVKLRKIRYRMGDLRAFISENRVKPGGDA